MNANQNKFQPPAAILALVLGLLLTAAAAGQDFAIDTIAGNGRPGNNGDRGVATEISIDQPFGVEIGPDGGLYVCEVGQHRIRRVDLATGRIETVAGSGRRGYQGDGGPAIEAQLNEPYEVRFDQQGNMLWVEMQNHVVRRLERASGRISTLAGTGQPGYGGDGGPATAASFRQPHSIALDSAGAIYIADIGNHRIRRIDPTTGMIESIAGNGEKQLPRSGSLARGQPMLGPRTLAVADGVLWIALREGNSIWQLGLASGQVQGVAGSGRKGFRDGADLQQVTFNGPKGIALGPSVIDVVDTENHAIRRIDLKQKTLRTIAGRGPDGRGYGGDGGPATAALLDRPHGICAAPDGTLYIGDTNNHRVRRLRPK
jgi:streptogramin lyase